MGNSVAEFHDGGGPAHRVDRGTISAATWLRSDAARLLMLFQPPPQGARRDLKARGDEQHRLFAIYVRADSSLTKLDWMRRCHKPAFDYNSAVHSSDSWD